MRLLLISRFLLYYFVVALPVIHPGVAVSYDSAGWWLWFVIVPVEMLIAYFLAPPRLRPGRWLLSALAPLLIALLFITGVSGHWLLFLAAGGFGFLTTALVFKTGGRGRTVASLEVFVLASVTYRMLNFSRASEEIARAGGFITQAILAFCFFAFLVHSMLLYFALYRSRPGRAGGREMLLFSALAAALVLLVVFLLPPDFVRHSVVFNRLSEPPEPDIVPLDEYEDGLPGGNLRGERSGEAGEAGGEEDGRGEGNRLEGMPADQWGKQGSGRGSENRQYAVMVVASRVDPVYAAEAYFDRFDRDRGFMLSVEDPLNDLVFQRLLETWRNRRENTDARREPAEMFFLSTIPDRVLAYDPRAIEPTVFSMIFHPFDYSYAATSAVSTTDRRQWSRTRELSTEERAEMAHYLAIPLDPEDRELFEGYLGLVVEEGMSIFERIDAILKAFSVFQYNIGFDDDVSTVKMLRFLLDTRDGDCTEFSNTAAILARLAGIPTRVVTGYLSSSNLQTPAHRRGIAALRESIEPLRDFPEHQLNLVTTAHRHSWVQFYLPDYGWLDFETTAYALPPMGSGDPNSMNVVIPLIQAEPAPAPEFAFPWRLALKTLGVLVGCGLLAVYLYRCGKRISLSMRAAGRGTAALNALYRATLMRLAEEGFRIKRPSETPLEYAAEIPGLARFAKEYTRLRYKEGFQRGEEERLWRDIRLSQRSVLETERSRGIVSFLKRIFTLRGIGY